MAIFEFPAQALAHFLFHPRLSVGGEELASQVVWPWSLARHGNVSDQTAQSRATTHLLALQGGSGCGEQRSLCSEQKPVCSDAGDTLWVLYLPFLPVLTSCHRSPLSKSKIKLNRRCHLEDISPMRMYLITLLMSTVEMLVY